MVPSHASEEALAYRDNMPTKNEKSHVLMAESLDSYMKHAPSISICTYPWPVASISFAWRMYPGGEASWEARNEACWESRSRVCWETRNGALLRRTACSLQTCIVAWAGILESSLVVPWLQSLTVLFFSVVLSVVLSVKSSAMAYCSCFVASWVASWFRRGRNCWKVACSIFWK